MNYLVELDKAEHEVRDLEYRHANVKNGLMAVDKEIILLALKELALIDNIKNLKKKTLVVSASEFRRSKEDLNRTQTRLGMIRSDKKELGKALKAINEHLDKARANLEELRQLKMTNVIEGKFGRKNG